ncbi:carboxypeptidase-like regulatory domain-containing protein [Chitinophaga agrisoli]|nr:carboxypeptidase-like regulatory domain-containing protein [Chitinophaga agrisoli]
MPIPKNRQWLSIGAILPLFLLLLAGLQPAWGQVKLTGMVVDADTKTGLPAATIINKRTQAGTITSESGRFYIEAAPGDTIEFSMLSYYKKEIVTPVETTSFNIYLPKRIFGLQEVNVKGRNYHLDSLANREEYGKYFNYKKPGALDVLKTLPANPVTALSYLVPSKARKRKEHFHEQLDYWEKENYIDYRYSAELVGRMTKLESPELDSFMLHYRPGYQFLQNATDYDLMLYIKQSFQTYQQDKAAAGK